MPDTVEPAGDRLRKNITPGTGVFWRMLNLFGLTTHPTGFGDDPESAGEALREWLDDKFKLGTDRRERYRIFDEMDQFDLIISLLDTLGEEATQPDYDTKEAVWIESSHAEMIKAGKVCLTNCAVQDKITGITRAMSKYGDHFRRLIYKTGQGVLGWKSMNAGQVFRVEDKYDRLIGFKQDGQKFRGEIKHPVSWPWDYVHFRLIGRDEHEGYGTSYLLGLFRSWRTLELGMDSVLMYRLRRAPDRNMVMVDVGDLDEHEAVDFVNRWRKRFRKHEYIDPASPDYRKQFNPLTPLEDIFIPVRGADSSTRVDQLSGAGNVVDIADIEAMVNMFYGAARAPKAYFGWEGDINAKATLMQQDVRWARTLKRVQKCAVYGLRQLLDIHYCLLAEHAKDDRYDPEQHPYVVQMSPIAYLDEWERLELLQLRNGIVEGMSRWAQDMGMNPRVWSMYILLNYAKLPEDLVLKLIAKAPQTPMGMGGGGEEEPSPGDEAARASYAADLMPLLEDESEITKALRAKGKSRLLEWADKEGMKLSEETKSWMSGFYPLSKAEEQMIGKLMHGDARLRKIVGDIAEVTMEDIVIQQTDKSMMPPRVVRNGEIIALADDYGDNPEAQVLEEHKAKLLEDVKNGNNA